MNRFIVLSGVASGLALLVIAFSWAFTPKPSTVVLLSTEWMCLESAPSGLNAICTMYTRVPTKKAVAQ